MAKYKNYPVRPLSDLREMVHTSAAVYGDATAFMQKENGEYVSYSFRRYCEDVDSLGAALCAKGLCDRRIILMGENCYAWVVSYLAVICGVGVIVPVDKEIPAEEVANIARISEAGAVLYSPKYEAKVAGIAPEVEKIGFDALPGLIEEGKTLRQAGDTTYADRRIDPDALSSLIFTSGTTGVSKGVMLSHRNICFNLEQMCQMIYIGPKDLFLSVLPLHHAYECTCGFLCQVYRGSAVAFSEGLRYITRNMNEVHPTIMLCVPLLAETMYRKIWTGIRKKGIEEKVSRAIKMTNRIRPESARVAMKKKVFSEIHAGFGGKLKLLICGGAAVDPEVLRGLRDFGILAVQGYGLTECAPLAAVNRDTYYNDHAAGMATPGGELEIVNVQEDGTGEIRYRGGNVMLGYFGMPELTAETIKDGWFLTGDLGFIDPDGFLRITGRKKNVIVTYNGKNVFPEELEAYLGRNPLIAESVVVGIMNEKKKDYDIVALIWPNTDRAAELLGKDYSSEQLDGALREAIATVNAGVQSYKRIENYLLWPEEFPKNSSRKIKRAGLLERAEELYKA